MFFRSAGFGNNAVEMQTRADLDVDKDEWVISTPTTLAQKYWITNGKLGKLLTDVRRAVASQQPTCLRASRQALTHSKQ